MSCVKKQPKGGLDAPVPHRSCSMMSPLDIKHKPIPRGAFLVCVPAQFGHTGHFKKIQDSVLYLVL